MAGENNATTSGLFLSALFFDDTAATTGIEVFTSSGNFVQYSTVCLYGISNA